MERTLIRTKLDQVRSLIDRGFVYFDFEQILEHHYRRWVQPGDTVIDIGAHVGRHLRPLLDCIGQTGRAIAFEPIPAIYKTLESKFTDCPVTLNNMALSDYTGFSEFTYAEGSPEESGLVEREFNNPDSAKPSKINVKVDTLDNYTQSLTSVSFIKIDIEGGEINCLRGAEVTISKFRPIIALEYGELTYKAYGNSSDTLFEFAKAHCYTPYDLFLNKVDDVISWRSCLNHVYWDFILVPDEKISEFERRVCSPPTYKLPDPRSSMVSVADFERVVTDRDTFANLLEAERAKSKELGDMLDAVLASTSWRITAPLRRFLQAFRS
ncbi:FkbM family methyltransferase [Pseudomonas sp. Irchel s3h9]|uniref:FkbM family methyltransferase n=1 Tax=Pseudomonas sp. Irchel s3h9 TaxID=2009192 RepID=UPI000BA3AFB4|nr:FkbM family methyltransferase [Pseudomonas sp. Irchel s3h9]